MTPREVYTHFFQSLTLQLKGCYGFVDYVSPNRLTATLWDSSGAQETTFMLAYLRPRFWQKLEPRWQLGCAHRGVASDEWAAAIAKASQECEPLIAQLATPSA